MEHRSIGYVEYVMHFMHLNRNFFGYIVYWLLSALDFLHFYLVNTSTKSSGSGCFWVKVSIDAHPLIGFKHFYLLKHTGQFKKKNQTV